MPHRTCPACSPWTEGGEAGGRERRRRTAEGDNASSAGEGLGVGEGSKEVRSMAPH